MNVHHERDRAAPQGAHMYARSLFLNNREVFVQGDDMILTVPVGHKMRG